jgi:hypothetical protein
MNFCRESWVSKEISRHNWRPSLLVLLWMGVSGCNSIEVESGLGPTSGTLEEQLPVLVAFTPNSLTERGVGTVYIQINDERGNRETGIRHVDRNGVAWQQLQEAPARWFEFPARYGWQGTHFFVPTDGEQLMPHVAHDTYLCREECKLNLYYTEQVLDGSESVEQFWDATPELWRRAEFNYRVEDVVSLSTIARFDDATGYGVLDLAMVTIDVSGDQLAVSLETHPLNVKDLSHPAISRMPPRNDAAERESPSLMDAGTTAE